jgi:hypothetical protein
MRLQIFDSNGTELKVGDKALMQQRTNEKLAFYATIQIIDGQLYPFNKFSYDRIIKVDKIPSDCSYSPADIESGQPEYWMHPATELYLIENERLEKWRMDIVFFEHNNFFKVTQ